MELPYLLTWIHLSALILCNVESNPTEKTVIHMTRPEPTTRRWNSARQNYDKDSSTDDGLQDHRSSSNSSSASTMGEECVRFSGILRHSSKLLSTSYDKAERMENCLRVEVDVLRLLASNEFRECLVRTELLSSNYRRLRHVCRELPTLAHIRETVGVPSDNADRKMNKKHAPWRKKQMGQRPKPQAHLHKERLAYIEALLKQILLQHASKGTQVASNNTELTTSPLKETGNNGSKNVGNRSLNINVDTAMSNGPEVAMLIRKEAAVGKKSREDNEIESSPYLYVELPAEATEVDADLVTLLPNVKNSIGVNCGQESNGMLVDGSVVCDPRVVRGISGKNMSKHGDDFNVAKSRRDSKSGLKKGRKRDDDDEDDSNNYVFIGRGGGEAEDDEEIPYVRVVGDEKIVVADEGEPGQSTEQERVPIFRIGGPDLQTKAPTEFIPMVMVDLEGVSKGVETPEDDFVEIVHVDVKDQTPLDERDEYIDVLKEIVETKQRAKGDTRGRGDHKYVQMEREEGQGTQREETSTTGEMMEYGSTEEVLHAAVPAGPKRKKSNKMEIVSGGIATRTPPAMAVKVTLVVVLTAHLALKVVVAFHYLANELLVRLHIKH